MSRPLTIQSIRAITLAGLAVLALWYALLGGGGIVVGPIELADDPVGWLVALASLVADIALLIVIRRVRRARRVAARSEPLTPDDRMWSAHLAWLDGCAARGARKRGGKASQVLRRDVPIITIRPHEHLGDKRNGLISEHAPGRDGTFGDRQWEAQVTSTAAVLGSVVLPSTSTAADGFSALLGLAFIAIAAVFFVVLRRRTI